MSSEFEQITFEPGEGVARITLNRPEALNPLSIRMADEVCAALTLVATEPELRAVLITGAGRGFSSGADIGGSEGITVTDSGRPNVLRHLRGSYNPLILAVRELPKPIVAAINGPAAGIGCSLALACDHVLMASSGYLLLAFARLGLTMDGGCSALVAARAGLGRAAEMGLLAERVPAAQALEWGLVDRVVADEVLGADAEELARRLARGPTLSYAASKRLLNATALPDLAAQLDREAVEQQRLAESEDFGIGVLGFLNKQEPEFGGS